MEVVGKERRLLLSASLSFKAVTLVLPPNLEMSVFSPTSYNNTLTNNWSFFAGVVSIQIFPSFLARHTSRSMLITEKRVLAEHSNICNRGGDSPARWQNGKS